MTAVSVDVEDLTAGYGAVTVLRGLTLHVPAGHILGVVGANGAGKTTLLRSISGLTRTTSGRVTIGDQNVTGRDPSHIARLGVAHVPEGRRVFRGMSVRENLLVGTYGGRTTRHQADDRLRSVLAIFQRLHERLDSNAETLSGGEAQMLSIGRALMSSPAVLLLDEPTQGLSPAAVQALTDALAEVTRGGVTAILVEQNVEMVRALVDSVALVSRGTTVRLLKPDDLGDRNVLARLLTDHTGALSDQTLTPESAKRPAGADVSGTDQQRTLGGRK